MTYRTILIFSITTVILVFLNSCNRKIYNKQNIIGQWKGEHNGKTISIIFKNNGKFESCFLYLDLSECNKYTGNFYIDYSKYPISMSFKQINEITDNLFTIMKFINNNTIVISKFSTRWKLRPISFSQGEYFTLNRVNNLITN